MTPRLVFRAEARTELREAREWYEARSAGLSLEFARAMDASLAAIRRHPEAYPVVEGDIRRVILRRFPYQVLYYREGAELVILACFHHRRDPDLWRSRL